MYHNHSYHTGRQCEVFLLVSGLGSPRAIYHTHKYHTGGQCETFPLVSGSGPPGAIIITITTEAGNASTWKSSQLIKGKGSEEVVELRTMPVANNIWFRGVNERKLDFFFYRQIDKRCLELEPN